MLIAFTEEGKDPSQKKVVLGMIPASDRKAPILDLWEFWSTPSLPLLPDSL